MRAVKRTGTILAVASTYLPVLLLGGCLKQIALNSAANALSGNGTVYSSDNDPELVRDAIPFGLKTMEQLADSLPRHIGIRVALDRTCTSLAVGFFKEDAERMEERDVKASVPLYKRAKKMSLRARNYGLEALDLRAPGAKKAFLAGDEAAEKASLAKLTKDDVELLYWVGASWGAAISTGKDDMELVGQLPRVGLVMERALALDEAWDMGSLHEFFILFDSGRGTDQGGGPDRATAHYKRALELDHGARLSPKVSLAETVYVDAQKKADFTRLLTEVVNADVDAHPADRLVNIIAQRRARWLLSRTDELFAQ
jgi:predicted anti-sigma-YlaC factor YlaD